ncbi:MAG TPA: hypothetical protein VM260_05085, partial [Pirellula sp.]|nr:hypothetical protein [Pirellula sp.]
VVFFVSTRALVHHTTARLSGSLGSAWALAGIIHRDLTISRKALASVYDGRSGQPWANAFRQLNNQRWLVGG